MSIVCYELPRRREIGRKLKLWSSTVSTWEPENSPFLYKSEVVPLLYESWHRPVDDAILRTDASNTARHLSLWYSSETFPPIYCPIVISRSSEIMYHWSSAPELWYHVQSAAKNALPLTLIKIKTEVYMAIKKNYIDLFIKLIKAYLNDKMHT